MSDTALSIVISVSATIVGICVSFILGRVQSYTSYKKQILQERYDNFYVPFITRIYLLNAWEMKYSYLPKKVRTQIQLLILDNMNCLDEKTIECASKLYRVNVDFNSENRWKEDNDKRQEEEKITFPAYLRELAVMGYKTQDENILNDLFRTLTIAVLERSQEMSKKLKRPNIAEYALTKFAQESQAQ